MKIVINGTFGGFGLSQEALHLMAKRGMPIAWKYYDEKGFPIKSIPDAPITIEYKEKIEGWWIFKETVGYYLLSMNYDVYDTIEFRTNPILIEVVEELGSKADSNYSELKIIEVPDSEKHNIHISQYDGWESISQNHKRWNTI
jgi:hypothetical protein